MRELEENQSEKHRIKRIVLVLAESMPLFRFKKKPWEYEEMKNSDEKVNIGAFREVKKQY